MKRIRYFDTGFQFESKPIALRTGSVKVIIGYGNSVIMMTEEGKVAYSSKSFKTRIEAMKHAKEWLRGNGVIFDDEVRKVVKLDDEVKHE